MSNYNLWYILVMMQFCNFNERVTSHPLLLDPEVQVAYVGSSARFKCYSHKAPQWRRNNNEKFPYRIISRHDGHEETIELREVTLDDTGIYYCKSRLHGEKRVFKGKLFVGAYGEGSIAEGNFVGVPIGTRLILNCNSEERFIKWFYKPSPLDANVIPLQQIYGQLSVMVPVRGAGSYFCYGTNEKGQKFLDDTYVAVYEKDIVQPSILEVREGQRDSVEFTCDLPNVKRWSWNGKELPNNAIESNGGYTVKIDNVNRNHEGVYVCEGAGGRYQSAGIGKLKIKRRSRGQPKTFYYDRQSKSRKYYDTTYPKRYQYESGRKSDRAKMFYYDRHSQLSKYYDTSYPIRYETEHKLEHDRVQGTEEMYQPPLESELVSSDIELQVDVNPSSYIIKEGNDMVFSCNVNNRDYQHLIWKFNGGPLLKNTWKDDTDKLRISKATLSNSGSYTCEAITAIDKAATDTGKLMVIKSASHLACLRKGLGSSACDHLSYSKHLKFNELIYVLNIVQLILFTF